MNKFLILIKFLIFCFCTYEYAFSNVFYFGNNEAVNLTNRIKFEKSKVSIITGESVNPNIVPVNAKKGSLYIKADDGVVYVKMDDGESTNWTYLTDISLLESGVNLITTNNLKIKSSVNAGASATISLNNSAIADLLYIWPGSYGLQDSSLVLKDLNSGELAWEKRAKTNLNNLENTAVNADIIPDMANTRSLGDIGYFYKYVYSNKFVLANEFYGGRVYLYSSDDYGLGKPDLYLRYMGLPPDTNEKQSILLIEGTYDPPIFNLKIHPYNKDIELTDNILSIDETRSPINANIYYTGTSPTTLFQIYYATSLNEGTIFRFIGTSDTNTLTIDTNDVLDGWILNGKVVLRRYQSIDLMYSKKFRRFIEISRSN